jgi:hypothetical protein
MQKLFFNQAPPVFSFEYQYESVQIIGVPPLLFFFEETPTDAIRFILERLMCTPVHTSCITRSPGYRIWDECEVPVY